MIQKKIDVLLSPEEKSHIQANLVKVINNETPLILPNQIDTSYHSVDLAIEKWKNELLKLQSSDTLRILSTSPNETNNMEKSVIAEHKIIAAHVSGMVPFGK